MPYSYNYCDELEPTRPNALDNVPGDLSNTGHSSSRRSKSAHMGPMLCTVARLLSTYLQAQVFARRDIRSGTAGVRCSTCILGRGPNRVDRMQSPNKSS